MSEYIDREAALEICEAEYQARLRMCDYCGDTVAWNIGSEIKALPAADVAPVRHGRWIYHDDGVFTCSECDNAESNDSYYCRLCGAKMDGV
mgnify:CR=1 FL=1